MYGERSCLQIGTQIETEYGSIYQITGSPIGCGGGSMIYPARKISLQNGLPCSDGLLYALKECYPYSGDYHFIRHDSGEIRPAQEQPDAYRYLFQAQQLQLSEGLVSQHLYKTASRMLPIREVSQQVILTIPGKNPVSVSNTITVMDSLSEKGRSLSSWMQEKGRFSPAAVFRILQQLLFALKEVHEAGYLHLDIQDGNIFLRGTLEEKSELVTLIDFGCARIMKEGKTDPIRDRVIFTTRGYSAPEILLNNDGTLQLGPEADLYSVGCLALYLLTGQIPDARALLANRSGIYLPPNQIRRIKCPKHLTDRLQGLLAKALTREPENRYQSADEMLADVTDLAEALQPYRSDLANVDYDAFVCYKHGRIDSQAAAFLQKKLEAYRSPRGVCDRKNPFRRVFVDEGELSSCADFGEQIHRALQNSGWLIVICSPATPLSPWVQNEIDTFLRYHDRSRILAVLTEGEPQQSFPPQLLGRSDGSGEVLAADARGSSWPEVRKKLSGDALLRLAAPMLGTTFDSLKQRRKIQLFQRLAAATAAALSLTLAFSAYAVRQNQRIQSEYRKNLISESKYLATLAENAYDSGDPLKAREIALRALPSQDLDRPVVPQAQFILEQSLGLYSLGSGNLVGPATAKADYRHEKAPYQQDIVWDSDRNLLLSCDNRSLYVFDTANHRSMAEIPFNYEYNVVFHSGLVDRNAGQLFYGCHDQIFCYDYASQMQRWQYQLEEDFSLCSMQYLPQQQKIAAIVTDLFNEHVTVQLLDAATGACLKDYPITLDRAVESIYAPETALSGDESILAFEISFYTPEELTGSMDLSLQGSVVLLDLVTGSVRYIHPEAGWISQLSFSPDDQLLVTLLEGENASGGFYATFSEAVMTVLMADPESGTEIWRVERSYSGFQDRTKMAFDSDGQRLVLISYANQCMVLNCDNGEILKHYALSDSVINISSIRDHAFHAYTADGYQHYCRVNEDDWSALQYFPENVIRIIGYNGTFFAVHQDDHSVIRQYELYTEDQNWQPLVQDGSNPGRTYTKTFVQDNVIVLYGLYGEPLTLYHTADGQLSETILACAPQGCSISLKEVLGIREVNGNQMLLFSCHDSCTDTAHSPCSGILAVDVHTLEQQMIYLPKPQETLLQRDYTVEKGVGLVALDHCTQRDVSLNIDAVSFSGDTAYFSCLTAYTDSDHVDQNAVFWYAWKIGSKDLPRKIAQYVIPQEKRSAGNGVHQFAGILPGPDGQHGLLVVEDFGDGNSVPTHLFAADFSTGSLREIPADIPRTDSFRYGNTSDFGLWWSADGTQFALVSGHSAGIYDKTGTQQAVIDFNDAVYEIESLFFLPNSSHLIIWSDTNLLSMFGMDSGTLLAQEAIPLFITPTPEDVCWRLVDEHMLILDFGHWMTVIDPSEETWGVSSVIPNAIGYDEAGDRFYTRAENSMGKFPLGYFQRYTMKELVSIGSGAS